MTRARRPAGAWRWAGLWRAPHRQGFFAAAMVLLMASWWWCGHLLTQGGRSGGSATAWPASQVHALLMIFGFMPLFFVGFLFTAGPRWLKLPALAPRRCRGPVVTLLVAWPLFLVGGRWHAPLAAAALFLSVGGWIWFVGLFVGLVSRSPADDQFHARAMVCASVSGAWAWLQAAMGVALAAPDWVQAACAWGLWGFLLPVYVIAADRLTPALSTVHWPWMDRRAPHWLVCTLLVVVTLKGGHAWLVGLGMSLPAVWDVLLVWVSCVSGVAVLGLSWRWSEVQNMRLRMLAMLNIGVAWLGVALILPEGSRESVHALSMGFMGSVWLAMVSRVSSTMAGRSVAADQFTWTLFWLLQCAAALRVVARWLPGAATTVWWWLAIVLWAGMVTAWSVRHVRWWGQD